MEICNRCSGNKLRHVTYGFTNKDPTNLASFQFSAQEN